MTRDHKGKEYSVIMGKLKGEDTMTEQAYRYPKDTWSASEARSHCDNHGGSFEAARDTKKAQAVGQGEGPDNIENNLSSKKEDLIMTKAELEKQHPELYAEVLNLGEETGKQEAQVTITALQGENTTLTEKNKQLEKDLLIEKSNGKAEKTKTRAEKIMDEILAESSIDEKLYADLRRWEGDYTKHKTQDGDFDEEAFKTAFQKAVTDLEAKLPQNGLGLGLAEGKKDKIGSGATYSDENAEILADYKK